MLGLISGSKSWPRRPGRGEILPLTSDLWHSGICACGSQHEMHATSNSVCLYTKLSVSEASSSRRVCLVLWSFQGVRSDLKAYGKGDATAFNSDRT